MIPLDVREAANDAYKTFLSGDAGIRELVTNAIMAERERCAKIAFTYGTPVAGLPDGKSPAFHNHRNKIGRLILGDAS